MRLKGQLITEPGPDRMIVFQWFEQLLPWKTVKQNVAFALETAKKLPKREAASSAMHYVEKVGLAKFAHNYPHMLSGGMKLPVRSPAVWRWSPISSSRTSPSRR